MMKVQRIDRSVIGSVLHQNEVVHAVYMAPSDIAIVIGMYPEKLYCYKCLHLSSDASAETCIHIKLIRKTQNQNQNQNQMASTLSDQTANHVAMALGELITAISGLAPNNPNIVNAYWHLTQFRNLVSGYQPPVNGA